MKTHFISDAESHNHSLETLNVFYEFDDFMASIGTLVDMGCGSGADIEWWATRTTRDDNPEPLNIQCTAVDLKQELSVARRYPNIVYRQQDFEADMPWMDARKFDLLWCHDAFQFVINPFNTLKLWRNVVAKDGMMILILPQTTNLEFNTQAFDQRDYCYNNWTMVSLIHTLAVCGWDCRSGFFRKEPNSAWLHAVVYRSDHEPMDPRTTRWYDLMERGLLPESAEASIKRQGYVRQRDLVLPWLDKSLHTFAGH